MTDTTTPDLATVAAAYRQAADLISTADELRDYTDDHMGDICEAAEYLRRRADELHRAPVEPAVPAPPDDDRRERYTDAILNALAADTSRGPVWGSAAAAVMAVADAETATLRQQLTDAQQLLRRIIRRGAHADAVQREIGELIAQTHELRERAERAEKRAAAMEAERNRYRKHSIKAEQRAHAAEQRARELEQRVTTLEHVARGNKRHVQAIVPELERAEAALDRIRALHQPVEYRGHTICAHCSAWGGNSTDNAPQPYPCDTIRALDPQQ
jgi:signal transduction histidine kinase